MGAGPACSPSCIPVCASTRQRHPTRPSSPPPSMLPHCREEHEPPGTTGTNIGPLHPVVVVADNHAPGGRLRNVPRRLRHAPGKAPPPPGQGAALAPPVLFFGAAAADILEGLAEVEPRGTTYDVRDSTDSPLATRVLKEARSPLAMHDGIDGLLLDRCPGLPIFTDPLASWK